MAYEREVARGIALLDERIPTRPRDLVQTAIDRLDHAVLTVLASHATTSEQHAIIQDMTAAYAAILTLRREEA